MFYKVESLKRGKIQKNNWVNKICWICCNRHFKNFKKNFFSAPLCLLVRTQILKCLLRAYLPSLLSMRIPSTDLYPGTVLTGSYCAQFRVRTLTLGRFRPKVKHKETRGEENGFTLPQNTSTFKKAIPSWVVVAAHEEAVESLWGVQGQPGL